MSETLSCDVLIIGAGMAGSCLARQLRLRMPHLNVLVIDRKTSFDYWVGESTVEVWEDYMTRILHLGPYLERHHLQKHGLRFFFDSAEKNLSVSQMSEYGRSNFHSLHARQIDRARFDTDMCRMNRELGIDVRLGVDVKRRDQGEPPIKIDRDRGHTVRTSAGEVRCRWLIDAAGRNSPLTRLLDLIEPERRYTKGSYWARYKGCRVIDQLGDESWRRRINFTQRYHSTNHFMYRGYWIWHISIDDDVVSIGVEFDEAEVPLKIRNGTELTAWLRSHVSLDEILGTDAELLDFYGLKRIAYKSKEFFSTDRWFLTGMSGLFVSVLGSSTSRLYANTNRLIEEMIRADENGDANLFKKEVRHFNIMLDSAYESGIRFLGNLDRFGSYDVWEPFFGASLALYFNSLLPAATNDFTVEIDTARSHGLSCGCSVQSNEAIQLRLTVARLADEFMHFLDERGLYYDRNKGYFSASNVWEERPEIAAKIYKPRDLKEERRVSHMVYRDVCLRYIRRMVEIEGLPEVDDDSFDAVFIGNWRSGQSLADMLRALRLKERKTCLISGLDQHAAAGKTTGGAVSPELWFHRISTHYVQAQILFHLNQARVFEVLRDQGPLTVQDLADKLRLDRNVADVLLRYVHGIDCLLQVDSGGRYSLSPFGQAVVERFSNSGPKIDRGINMFDVRVGCFEPVWSNLGGMLSGQVKYGVDFVRNGNFADQGIQKFSQKFWPALSRILAQVKADTAVEVGITTDLLLDIGARMPGVRPYGIDRNPIRVASAKARAKEVGLETIKYLHGDIFAPDTWIQSVGRTTSGVLYSIHFHEFIAINQHRQDGLFQALKRGLPGWYVLVFEQPRMPSSAKQDLPEALWLYSQSNILIHELIGNGRILSRADWVAAGETSGCRLILDEPCDYLGYRAFLFQL